MNTEVRTVILQDGVRLHTNAYQGRNWYRITLPYLIGDRGLSFDSYTEALRVGGMRIEHIAELINP